MKKPLKECETYESCDGRCVDCVKMEMIARAAKETITIHNTAYAIVKQLEEYNPAIKMGIAAAVFAEIINHGCQETLAKKCYSGIPAGMVVLTPDQLVAILEKMDPANTPAIQEPEKKPTRIEVA